MSVPCSLVATCWERADLLALLYVMFSCVFVAFPFGVLGQGWYLIVSIPDLCIDEFTDGLFIAICRLLLFNVLSKKNISRIKHNVCFRS